MKVNAIYPGTFDPITFGHIDVIKKALKIVDNVIVAISETDNKNYFFDAIIHQSIRSRPFYEYGVWTASSFKYLIKYFDKGYGFDTFIGLPEDWDLGSHIEKAGSCLIVLECIKEDLAKEISKKLKIPTIGIGASKHCDGQVLVIDDIIGISNSTKKPKFVKSYANIEESIHKAVEKFCLEVIKKKFPKNKNTYK